MCVSVCMCLELSLCTENKKIWSYCGRNIWTDMYFSLVLRLWGFSSKAFPSGSNLAREINQNP